MAFIPPPPQKKKKKKKKKKTKKTHVFALATTLLGVFVLDMIGCIGGNARLLPQNSLHYHNHHSCSELVEVLLGGEERVQGAGHI